MKRFFSFFLFSFILISFSYAQNEYKVGIGIGSPILTGSSATVQSIRVPINLTSSLRIEPIFGYYSRETTEDLKKPVSKSDVYKTTTSGLVIGSGLYFQQQNENSNFYGGIQLSLLSLEEESVDKSDPDEDDTDKNEVDGYIFSPVIGGEYFFSDNFAIGAEVGVAIQKTTQKSSYESINSSQPYVYEIEANTMNTFASLTVRYFIF